MKLKFLLIYFAILLSSGCDKMLLGPGAGNNPIDNFDVLWKIIDEKYALFPVKNVNWDSLYTIYSKRITPSTGEDELWAVCCSLISHLNDGHVSLFNREYTKNFWSSDIDPAKKMGFSLDLVKKKFLENPWISGEGYITYGKIKNSNKGYIHISSFGPATNGRDWIQDIDQVNDRLSDSDTLIIDLRNNGGGFAKNDLFFASAYIDREILYYYSHCKSGKGHNDFQKPVARIIKPRISPLNTDRQIILLTNRFSSSGSEVVALIFKNLSYSVQIGEATTGCFGEVSQVGQMPNGWTFHFPCTLTTLPDGSSPEGIGIIPDIYVENNSQDIAEERDKVLERAIMYEAAVSY
jgi:carboxyl-terminal processing protease